MDTAVRIKQLQRANLNHWSRSDIDWVLLLYKNSSHRLQKIFESLEFMTKKNHDRFVKDEMRKKRILNKDILKKTNSTLQRESENLEKKKQIDFLSVAKRIARRSADLQDLNEKDMEKLNNGSKE